MPWPVADNWRAALGRLYSPSGDIAHRFVLPMKITGLKVDDEAFLVASLIDRCPRVMMLRELVRNGLDAAMHAPAGRRVVRLCGVMIEGTRKLAIWNTGPGMTRAELHRMCDLAASIRKTKGLDQNFGMGAKVASLAANALGMRYRSCHAGQVHEVMIGKRDGVYGRIMRPPPGGGFAPLVDIAEVTAQVRAEGGDLSEDWTEVVLFGLRADQDTVQDPYDGEPAVPAYLIPETLYHRFWSLPEGVEVRLGEGLHWLSGEQVFRPLSQRAAGVPANAEAVAADAGIVVHYLYDPPHPERPWANLSDDSALQRTRGTLSLVHRGEMSRSSPVRPGPMWPRSTASPSARAITACMSNCPIPTRSCPMPTASSCATTAANRTRCASNASPNWSAATDPHGSSANKPSSPPAARSAARSIAIGN